MKPTPITPRIARERGHFVIETTWFSAELPFHVIDCPSLKTPVLTLPLLVNEANYLISVKRHR